MAPKSPHTNESLRNHFHLTYEVGKGSQIQPPCVTILEWTPKNVTPLFTLDLVGKGVCFDTGGHNLKTDASSAKAMYGDKGGAIAQAQLFELIAQANLPIKVRFGAGWVVNVPGGFATMQSDIFQVGEITIEDGNTDAEGRLVMGSILNYFAQHDPANITTTMATLTGAALIGFGDYMAPMYAKTGPLAKVLQEGMQVAEDPVWHMPRTKAALKKLQGVGDADLYSVGGSYGGSMTADAFLSQLAAKTTQFVHFDIACADTGTLGFTPGVTNMDMFAVRGAFEGLKLHIQQIMDTTARSSSYN